MTLAVQAEGLVKRFGTVTALAGVDLAVPAGSIIGVLGPNGAGKTTTVRILATLLRPDAGAVRVAGYDALRDPVLVRGVIGLTGQYASVDEELTGFENLVLIGRLLELPRREARARATELLEMFDLVEAGSRPIRTYSGGMRRRIDLASSLVGRPRVLFLDEPTTGLDPRSRTQLWQVVRSLAAEGTSVLLTTQYLEEADALADEITVIDRGAVIASGTPAELKRIAGGRTIVVRPRDPARLIEVAAILNAVSGHGAETPRRDVVSVPVGGDGESAFAEVVRRLEAAGIGVSELSLRLPSLDEVFFTLTGHGTEEEAAA